MDDALGIAPGVPMPEWKRAAMTLTEWKRADVTCLIGLPRWNRVVHSETRLSGEMLATVGWGHTARAAPLLGVQAELIDGDGWDGRCKRPLEGRNDWARADGRGRGIGAR